MLTNVAMAAGRFVFRVRFLAVVIAAEDLIKVLGGFPRIGCDGSGLNEWR